MCAFCVSLLLERLFPMSGCLGARVPAIAIVGGAVSCIRVAGSDSWVSSWGCAPIFPSWPDVPPPSTTAGASMKAPATEWAWSSKLGRQSVRTVRHAALSAANGELGEIGSGRLALQSRTSSVGLRPDLTHRRSRGSARPLPHAFSTLVRADQPREGGDGIAARPPPLDRFALATHPGVFPLFPCSSPRAAKPAGRGPRAGCDDDRHRPPNPWYGLPPSLGAMRACHGHTAPLQRERRDALVRAQT